MTKLREIEGKKSLFSERERERERERGRERELTYFATMILWKRGDRLREREKTTYYY